MATQHFKRNLLLNLYREGRKKNLQFVSSCCSREIKMFYTYSLFPSFGYPQPSCLLPSQNSSKPGLPFHHQLPEFTQTHAHPVSDMSQPQVYIYTHRLKPPSIFFLRKTAPCMMNSIGFLLNSENRLSLTINLNLLNSVHIYSVFLSEKYHGQRSLVGYSQSVGWQRVRHD